MHFLKEVWFCVINLHYSFPHLFDKSQMGFIVYVAIMSEAVVLISYSHPPFIIQINQKIFCLCGFTSRNIGRVTA